MSIKVHDFIIKEKKNAAISNMLGFNLTIEKSWILLVLVWFCENIA